MAMVLLVMKRPGNARVMANALTTGGHTAISASNHEALTVAMAQFGGPCIAIVDVSDFGPADWQMCQTLHRHAVRFIVLCADHEARRGGQALRYGASSLLQKPIKKPVLLGLLSELTGEATAL
ncbi:CheY-like chemotaxis protein [Modicisalibacter xianhensis]|uniref:CheY-like chemotaxis protein n=1 Tax=Modicisalibacter xianhensis TaxID=442341 RepID=A0A4R8FM08_9GAMM|nr:response regulator [Halomonas xianhensis]TDX24795.1 CheY-like chemotaxis protein [Halomonas xianhensis]